MKKKITFIDILILAVIVALLAFVLSKVAVNKSIGGKTITYTVLVTNMLPEVADDIVPVDKTLIDAAENAYGKITNVEIKDNEDYYFDSKNEKYVKKTFDKRKDVYITIEAEAVENDWGYEVGSKIIRVGESQHVASGNAVANGYIVDVRD